jgi:REP element-mobilizing transposase RayT
MARGWRIEYEGAIYHVLSRGNERRDIFRADADRRLFLKTLGDCCDRFDTDPLAYVLMPNHYHLLLKTRRANLSRAMQWFCGTYTRRFNNRSGRSGHLFQGRFKSMLVENDAYAMQLSCYIHRNPLRAGLVERLADYPWSSYLCYAYGRNPPLSLSTDLILGHFGGPDPYRAYRQKVQRYAEEENRLWEDFRHGFILGSRGFVASIRERFLPELPARAVPQQRLVGKDVDFTSVLKEAAFRLGCDLRDLTAKQRLSGEEKVHRDLLVYSFWKTGLLTNGQVGELFGITYSAVSHCVKRVTQKLGVDEGLRVMEGRINSLFKL